MIPSLMAQWLRHRSADWYVLGSHLDTGSNPERVFKEPVSRCKATTPSTLLLTINKKTKKKKINKLTKPTNSLL